jgi:CDP-diacylglycerol---serine O-phosphatidyltransferase
MTFSPHSREAILSREARRMELKRRGRYLIPNAVTVGNMFCGFLATVYATSGRFEKAAIAIAIAILLDGMDGQVARKLNATSKFGVEFDSFSDLISFGLAPAFLVYHWAFHQQLRGDDFGVFVAFLYVVCAATRLARFNVTQSSLSNFIGLPSPAAAGMVAATVNWSPQLEEPTFLWLAVATVLLSSVGFLMISNIEFSSIKGLKLRTVHPIVRVSTAIIIALLWYSSRLGFLLVALGYCLSGPFYCLKQRLTHRFH